MNTKINVMFITECTGGVEQYLKLLLNRIDRSKFKVILIASKLYRESDFSDLVDTLEIVDLKHDIGFSTIDSIKAIKKLVICYKPDIVYAHSSIAGAVTRLACRNLDCKVIYNPHGWAFCRRSIFSKLYLYIERFLSRYCDKIVCISEAEYKLALKHKICKKEKLEVIPNGIDFDECDKQLSQEVELNIPNDAHVIGMVGRISKQKATDIFLKMANLVNKKVSNCYFIIVGDCLEANKKQREKLVEYAKENSINLIITGWVKNPLSYVKHFNLCCLLSRWEGFGLAIAEYMYCKKPVVATNVDAIPEIIKTGYSGILVDKEDYKSAAEIVINLLNNEILKNKLVDNAYKSTIFLYNEKRVVKQTEKLICSLLMRTKNEN